jgi:hypothetical protein
MIHVLHVRVLVASLIIAVLYSIIIDLDLVIILHSAAPSDCQVIGQ